MDSDRGKSGAFDTMLVLGVLALTLLGKSIYEDLLKAHVLKLFESWFGAPMPAAFVNACTEITISGGLAVLIIIFLYRYIGRNHPYLSDARERLTPKLALSFSPDDPLCKRPVNLSDGQSGDWYRLRVECASAVPVHNCNAVLLDVFRGELPIIQGETIRLSFAAGDSFNRTIFPGTPVSVDLFAVNSLHRAWLTLGTQDGAGSIDLSNVLSEEGDYKMRIAINSPETIAAGGTVVFKWRKNREGVKFEWLATP